MRLYVALVLLALTGCASQPYQIERVNDHLYRSPQPTTSADWARVREALGPGGVVVKLNDAGEGSDDGARAVGLQVYDFAIDPRGDGPLVAQAEGVFRKPDPATVTEALGVLCDPQLRTLVHCTHGMDRTGALVAMERVLCEGWAIDAAHDEWHRHARYVPHGPRIPAPGLEAAWHDFAERMAAVDDAARWIASGILVRDVLGLGR